MSIPISQTTPQYRPIYTAFIFTWLHNLVSILYCTWMKYKIIRKLTNVKNPFSSHVDFPFSHYYFGGGSLVISNSDWPVVAFSLVYFSFVLTLHLVLSLFTVNLHFLLSFFSFPLSFEVAIYLLFATTLPWYILFLLFCTIYHI